MGINIFIRFPEPRFFLFEYLPTYIWKHVT